jgi:AhpC/TSA family protein
MRLFLLLILFAQGRVFAQGGMPPPAGTLPAFRFERMGHGVLTNADLPKGKLLLFVFVDPDCDHCQRAVARMDAEYRSFETVALYFVSAADPAKIVAFAKKLGPRLKGLWLRDPEYRYMVQFRPVRYPALFLYSTDKKLLDYEDNEATIFRIVRSIKKIRG